MKKAAGGGGVLAVKRPFFTMIWHIVLQRLKKDLELENL